MIVFVLGGWGRWWSADAPVDGLPDGGVRQWAQRCQVSVPSLHGTGTVQGGSQDSHHHRPGGTEQW